MIISCPKCLARVDAEQLSCVEEVERNEGGLVHGSETLISLLRCPSCSGAIISKQEVAEFDSYRAEVTEWSRPKRVWPEPELTSGGAVPLRVSVSLDEARGCLASGFYTASVVLSGRALEAIARHFQIPGPGTDRIMLGRGLKQLHESGKIDDRLFEWGKELQEHRNLAAHATDHVFEQEDAQDLFEFLNAICDYLFVLQNRYDRFVARKERRRTESKAVETSDGSQQQ